MADLQTRNLKKPKPKPKPKSKSKPEVRRALEEYPVWVLDSETFIPYAAILTNEHSLSESQAEAETEKLLEIKEGDVVTIKLRGIKNQKPPEGFQPLKNARGLAPLYAYPPKIKSM